MSLNNISIWDMLNRTIEIKVIVAITLGIKIFFPDKIQRPIIIITPPNVCSSSRSGTKLKINVGKYPTQALGLKYADIAGYRSAKATPPRSSNCTWLIFLSINYYCTSTTPVLPALKWL